jgi:hypothetical protein
MCRLKKGQAAVLLLLFALGSSSCGKDDGASSGPAATDPGKSTDPPQTMAAEINAICRRYELGTDDVFQQLLGVVESGQLRQSIALTEDLLAETTSLRDEIARVDPPSGRNRAQEDFLFLLDGALVSTGQVLQDMRGGDFSSIDSKSIRTGDELYIREFEPLVERMGARECRAVIPRWVPAL